MAQHAAASRIIIIIIIMILSHKYRFIFIKSAKTAGTSIEIALSKFCGPTDVITPFALDDEKIRSELGYPGPQNYLAPFWSYRLRDVKNLLVLGQKKFRFHAHMSAQAVKAVVPQHIWQNYFKFCVERNPWDRVVSLYYYKPAFRSCPRPTVSEFVESNGHHILKQRGHGLYTIDGQIVVDRICRYETLAEELEDVRMHLGIPEALTLPRAKSHYRKAREDYRDLFNDRAKAMVAELFQEEIERFDYTF